MRVRWSTALCALLAMGFDKTTGSVSETPESHRKKWLKWPAKKPKGRQLDAGSTPSLSIKSSSTVSIYDPERELGEATDGKSLWDRAYDALRNDDPKLVLKYEKLLSTELSRIGKSMYLGNQYSCSPMHRV